MSIIATRQDSYVQSDDDLRIMLARVSKRRNCHASGHQGCKGHWVRTGEDHDDNPTGFRMSKCVPGPDGNCRSCKDEYVPRVVRHAKTLSKLADLILKGRP